jgi:hypothetical protein
MRDDKKSHPSAAAVKSCAFRQTAICGGGGLGYAAAPDTVRATEIDVDDAEFL